MPSKLLVPENNKYRFHVLGLPYSSSTKEYTTCAFTQGVIHFCKMMMSLGHTVYHYGHKDSKVECTEHITIFNDDDLKEWYGEDYIVKKTWKLKGFSYDSKDKSRDVSGERMFQQIIKRIHKYDWVCNFDGSCSHRLMFNLFKGSPVKYLDLEPQIGHLGPISTYRVYTSYSLLDKVSVRQPLLQLIHDEREKALNGKPVQIDNKDMYKEERLSMDYTVIPYCIDEDEFKDIKDTTSSYSFTMYNGEQITVEPGYVLYLARVTWCKGLDKIIYATELAGKRLIVAGPGGWDLPSVGGSNTTVQASYSQIKHVRNKWKLEHPFTHPYPDMHHEGNVPLLSIPSHVTFVGMVEDDIRKELIARCLTGIIYPTYIEPFGKISIEFNILGKPLISSNRGGYVEVIEDSVNGYLCETLHDMIEALHIVTNIKSEDCIRKAKRYTLPEIAKKYQRYFNKIWKSRVEQPNKGWFAL